MTNDNQQNTNEIELQLGDVIHITNPSNENLNEQTFIIDYIDKTKIYLINIDVLNKSNVINRFKLNINEDGILGDGNITKIELLNRADSPSYARQNGLLPGKWINIYFGGDYPTIIVGEITNLEQDMIEIRTPEKDILYINFDYKGIPEDLPIENIEIRDKPSSLPEVKEKEQEQDILEQDILEQEELALEEISPDKKIIETEKLKFAIPTKEVKDQLREIIIKADQIIFGDEELGKIKQFVDVSSKIKRFSIETQVNDWLDELLSTIPNSQRTPRVLNNIHITIERFKQLREQFSTFDQYGNVTGFIKKEATYKPLQKWLNKFNKNLYWIIPIVKNVKKIYNAEYVNENNADYVNINMEEDMTKIETLYENYKSNSLPGDNKYTSYYSELLPYFTPFNYVDDEDQRDVIIEKEVLDNINVVINNLEDMYSSVFSNNIIRNKRFLITKYNLADTKLDILETTSGKMTTVRVKINSNDLMSVKSIMTLQEPVIRFSKVNLPGTDILTRANLNQVFVNYWQLLKKNTTVHDVFVESLNTEFDFNENEYVSSIRNYIINIPENETKGMTKQDIYESFTNTIVPKIRVLFNLMKKYIKGKLSIVDVVSYLEPFFIYTDDLTYNQYREIIRFIDEKISEHNKKIVEFSRIFKMLSSLKQLPLIKSKAFSIVDILSSKLREEVFNTGYGFEDPENTYTNSEILKKMLMKDCSKLYTCGLAYQSLQLMIPKDMNHLFEEEKKDTEKQIKDSESQDKCNNIIIAKLYTSLEQLNGDNDKIIYFDKKYDKTNYGIMEDQKGYYKEVINMTPESLKQHIVADQMKKNKLSEIDANYLADTLIDGSKKVIDGQYALLYKGYSENVENENDYYVRKNNKWVLDTELSKKNMSIDESSILCDLQEKCINIRTEVEDKCESMKTNELSLQNNLLKNIISEFDTKYKITKEQLEKDVKEKLDYLTSKMPIINKMEMDALLKYNNQKFNIGLKENDYENDINKIKSPFSPLLDIILNQKDFVKQQNDIIKFANKFTRPSISGATLSGNFESPHWLYCIKTNAPLIPTFKKELAAAFLTSESEYQDVLNVIKSTIGQLSDDGDWWTDKHSGWPICPGDFDTEEGYDDGFKISSRAVMEEDAGNKIMAITSLKTVKYITPESIMINNIVNALSVAMGINIEIQKEFIINNVIETLKTTVESELDYREKVKIAAQKGKSILSYRDFFNTSLLFYTLGMFLIAVQTIIPSIKTRKTHPGCVRSFVGYPFDGQGDLSSLTYLACVIYDIRESGEPYNVLKKTSVEKIQTKIKSVIDSLLIQLPDVKRKMDDKTEYLLINPASDIPEEHDVANWSNFLPPLIPFKIRNLTNISKEFERSLVGDLKNGTKTQINKIMVIQSKIFQYSLAIQEKIQNIVKSHKMLLHTSNNEPYLENACCDSQENEATITYFTKRSPEIIDYNKNVKGLENLLDDIRSHTQSALFYSNINTKMSYPQIINKFDEKIIYNSFIYYCKFKSLMPIPVDLMPICTNKPDSSLIDPSDTIDRIIQKLKEDGRTYTTEQFLRLIQLISQKHIVPMDLNNNIVSSLTMLNALLDSIYNESKKYEIIDISLRDLVKNVIDTFDIAREEQSTDIKNLNNFLSRSIDTMKDNIIDFIKKISNKNITKKSIVKFVEIINNLSLWNMENTTRNGEKVSNDVLYRIVNFYKSFIHNFTNIFPTIILNKVNYDNINVPKYYEFSKNHTNKLENNIAVYFEKLNKFYSDKNIMVNILNKIQKLGKNLLKISQITPSFSNIKIGDKILKGVIDEDTAKYLFEYYLLSVLMSYIYLADDESMVTFAFEKESSTNITEIFSVDYIDETNTEIDLEVSPYVKKNVQVIQGSKKELKDKIAELLIVYMEVLNGEKEIIDVNYENIQDRVFKLKEREKKMVTDKLKGMSDEKREVDTIFKIIKEGQYRKGLSKGLVNYDENIYNEEQEMRETMITVENTFLKRGKTLQENDLDMAMEEYLEEKRIQDEIDSEVYNMKQFSETYWDGNYEGDELDFDDYNQEN